MERRAFLSGAALAAGGAVMGPGSGDGSVAPIRVIDKTDKLIPAGSHYVLATPVESDGWYVTSAKVRVWGVERWRFMFVNNDGANTTAVSVVTTDHHAATYQLWADADTLVGVRAEPESPENSMMLLTAQLKVVRVGDSRGTRIETEGLVIP